MSYTPKIEVSRTPEKTIASLEYIDLNNALQCLLIRGHNTNNPIILYIHGGPGISELPLIRHYNHVLERDFTLVYWEQRGTGMSYNVSVSEDSYNIAQFVEDAYELSKYLINRFGKKKIFIMGHSWGTIIATRLVLAHPELFYAYFGIGQVVHMKRGEKLSYEYVLRKAEETNNKKALNQLKQINNPLYLTTEKNSNWYKQLKTQRKWLMKFGGILLHKTDYAEIARIFLKSPEYSLIDLINLVRGNIKSVKKLWPEVMKVNFFNESTTFQIPVYFIQGFNDYNCPTELVSLYESIITAPRKELFIFRNSAHAPNFEESRDFHMLIYNIASKYKRGKVKKVPTMVKSYS